MPTKDRGYFLLGFVIIACYLAPYFISGQDVSIAIHDNLDSNLVWMKLMVEGGYFFNWQLETIPQILNGIPVSSLASTYDVSTLAFALFGSFWGYVFMRCLLALVGFVGMYLLLRKSLLPNADSLIVVGASLCFALLPYWGFTLSVAVLPWLFWAFMSIHYGNKDAKLGPWAVMVLAGFVSNLVLVGVFFIALAGMWTLYDVVAKRMSSGRSILALVFLSASYILTHIRIFIGFFAPTQTSHRAEINFLFDYDGQVFTRFNEIFFHGQYHASSMHAFIIPVVFFGLFLAYRQKQPEYKLINILEFIILSSLWYGVVNWSRAQFLLEPVTGLIPIQWGRLHFLQPLAWYVAFALALALIYKAGRYGKWIVGLCIILQCGILFWHFEGRTQSDSPSYRAFYSERLFDKIRADLSDPSEYRILCVAMHPSIAQYNGFYTLDGYCADYPLSYKHRFGRLIQGELSKSEMLQTYYHNWGSRAYAYSSKLGREFVIRKTDTLPLQSLEYDWALFHEMGGRYVFSAVPIGDGHLQLLHYYKDDDSAWVVYVYDVNP